MDSDPVLQRFLSGESTALPSFYVEHMRKDLGPFWTALPEGALSHDPNAYLRAHQAQAASPSRATDPRGERPVRPAPAADESAAPARATS